MPKIPLPPEVVNVLVLGSDDAPFRTGLRTDTIMVVSLNPTTGIATLLSIPRDYYVYIPGWGMDRINTAWAHGREDSVALTVEYNFGLKIHYWVRVNLPAFSSIVDTLGGIDVDVTKSLSDRCAYVNWYYKPGRYHMDGLAALCYVRMRYASSDFDRLRRQQEVIQAVFQKVLSLDGLSRIPQLYSDFSSLMKTNMTLDAVLPLAPLAAALGTDASRFHLFRIDRSMVTSYRVPGSGAAVLLPKRDAIQQMLNQAFPP